MRKRRTLKIALLLLLFAPSICAQRIKSMDFRNQAITDILMVLAEASGTSIIPDETVQGTASFYFSDSELEEALELFLSAYKLYYKRTGNTIRVSRVDGDFDPAKGTVSLRAADVDVESLIRGPYLIRKARKKQFKLTRASASFWCAKDASLNVVQPDDLSIAG